MDWQVIATVLAALNVAQLVMVLALRDERDSLKRTLAWKNAQMVRDGEKVYVVRKERV